MLIAGFVAKVNGRLGNLRNASVVIRGMKPAGRRCIGKGCLYTFMIFSWFRAFEAKSGFLACFGRLPAYVGSVTRRRVENNKSASVEHNGWLDGCLATYTNFTTWHRGN